MIEGFHTREGVYFRRDRYDNVTVIVAESAQVDAPILRELTLPPNEWASVVASMSRTGETSESYEGALHFHTFDPDDAT